MKDKILKIVELHKEISVLENDPALRAHVKAVAVRYNNAECEIYGGSCIDIDNIDMQSIDGDTVNVKYSFHSGYRCDEGEVDFDVEYLYDDELLVKFENDCIRRHANKEKEKLECKKKEKLAEIERLQRELEKM